MRGWKYDMRSKRGQSKGKRVDLLLERLRGLGRGYDRTIPLMKGILAL